MITSWEMYWFTRLDGVHDSAIAVLVLASVAALFCAVGYGVAVSEEDDSMLRRVRPMLVLTLLAMTVGAAAAILVPTTKEMAAIKVVPLIANSESVKKIGDVGNNMLDLANEWLLELKPKKAE